MFKHELCVSPESLLLQLSEGETVDFVQERRQVSYSFENLLMFKQELCVSPDSLLLQLIEGETVDFLQAPGIASSNCSGPVKLVKHVMYMNKLSKTRHAEIISTSYALAVSSLKCSWANMGVLGVISRPCERLLYPALQAPS